MNDDCFEIDKLLLAIIMSIENENISMSEVENRLYDISKIFEDFFQNESTIFKTLISCICGREETVFDHFKIS